MRAYIAIAAFAAVVVLGSADLASARDIGIYKESEVKADLREFFDAGDKKIKAMADDLYKLAGTNSAVKLAYGVAEKLISSIRTIRRRALTKAVQSLEGAQFDRELRELLSTAEELNEELDGRINKLLKIAEEYLPKNNSKVNDYTMALLKILHEGLEHIEFVDSQGEKYKPVRSRMLSYKQ